MAEFKNDQYGMGFDVVGSDFGGVSNPLLKRSWLHFVSECNLLMKNINESASGHGFWDTHNISEKLCLIHSEISEALEASRKDINAPDHHIPEFTNFTVELADTVIRALDLAYEYNLPIAEAIVAKHEYNKTRPHRHGKKF